MIISGGTVDEIKICENAYVSSVSVRIEGDAKVDQLVVGCNKDEYGEFDEATIISESNRRTKISMGYSGGQIVSDAVSNLDKYMMIKINGDTLEGITQFEGLPGCLVNNMKRINLHAPGGLFDDNDRDSLVYNAEFLDSSGEVIYEIDPSLLPIPKRDGYVFKGWSTDEEALFIESSIGEYVNDLYAVWQNASNPMPFDLFIQFNGVKQGEIELNPIGGACTVEIPSEYDKNQGVFIIGRNAKGEKINVPVKIGSNGIGYAKIESTSYDGNNSHTYIVNLVERARLNQTIENQVQFSLEAWDGITTDEFDEPVLTTLFYEGKWSDEGIVIEVPYGTIENGFVKVTGFVNKEGITINGQDWLDECLDLNKEYFEYHVKDINNNKEKTYKFKIVESNGESAELNELWIGFGDVNGQYYHSERIDLSKSEGKETKIYVPYYYNEEIGINTFDVGFNNIDNIKIEGLDDIFSYNGEAEKTINVKTTSANGKVHKTYKLKIIRDTKGNSTELKSLSLSIGKFLDEDGETIEEIAVKDIDLEEAMTEAGATLVVPEEFDVKQGYYELEAITKMGAGIYVEKKEPYSNFIYWNPDIYMKPADYNKTSDTLEFEIISANGEHKQKYKVTVYQKGKGPEYDVGSSEDNASNLFEDKEKIRFAGLERVETSILVADGLKKSWSVEKFKNIIVASGSDYPDALTGSYLAKVKEAPVILVRMDKDTELMAKEYIDDNLQKGGTVYILGGVGAVSERFEKSIGKQNVKRLYGDNRYQTNLAILDEAEINSEEILICSGKDYADSLSASAVGKTIMLVGDNFTGEQSKYLKGLDTNQIYIVGGIGAVNKNIENNSKKYANVARVYGDNRYTTSVAVAKKFFKKKCENIVLARAYDFPDGLSGGPLAMAIGSPLLLVENIGYRDTAEYAGKAEVNRVAVLGGPSLISDKVVNNIIN